MSWCRDGAGEDGEAGSGSCVGRGLESGPRRGEGRTDPEIHTDEGRPGKLQPCGVKGRGMSGWIFPGQPSHTHAGTWSGPPCSAGWGQEVEQHLGYKSVSPETCLACLSGREVNGERGWERGWGGVHHGRSRLLPGPSPEWMVPHTLTPGDLRDLRVEPVGSSVATEDYSVLMNVSWVLRADGKLAQSRS